MNLIKILTYLGGTILVVTITLSYFYMRVVTNFVFNYGNINSAFSSQITSSYFHQHDKVKRKLRRLQQVESSFQDRAQLVRCTVLSSLSISWSGFILRNVCDQFAGHIGEPSGIKNIIWSIAPQHNMLMCRTAKHGSTTWANIFVQILSKK